MEAGSFPFGEAVKFGWQKIKENFWKLVVITLIWMVIASIFDSTAKNFKETMPALYFLVNLCRGLVDMVITLGVLRITLKAYAGEKFEIAEMFYCRGEQYLNYFVASILYSLAVLAGFVLLIVPGVILLVRMGLYGYLIVDKNMGIIDSLKESMRLTKGNTFNLSLFCLLMLGIILLGILALLVGSLVAVPVAILACAFVYRYLEAKGQPAQLSPQAP